VSVAKPLDLDNDQTHQKTLKLHFDKFRDNRNVNACENLREHYPNAVSDCVDIATFHLNQIEPDLM
jgi:hypothetical protein